MTVLHRNLTDPDIHEPKNIVTQPSGRVYRADGFGTGEWIEPDILEPTSIDIPVGTLGFYAGTSVPNGWFLCYGQEISRATYSDLFLVLDTTFGDGNGTTTFNLPDIRGCTIEVKAGDTLNGDIKGSEKHLIVEAELPILNGTTNTTGAHSHVITPNTSFGASGSLYDVAGSSSQNTRIIFGLGGVHTHTFTMNAASLNLPHNNVQPTIILNTIIFHGVL